MVKRFPIDSIDADFNAAAVRSTDISNGPTDIGSNEFNTATAPPALYVYGRHLPGGSDTIYSNNRIVAILKWGNTGTLPTLGTARFYSGVWPSDPTNNGTIANARLMSGYFDIPASGGSGYTYDITLYYDSSMLGKAISEAGLKIYKRQSGVPGSWQILPTAVDTAAQTLVASNLSSFSEFTGIDLSASFPVKLASFYGFIVGKDVKLTWTSATETAHDYYEIERSYDAINFEKIGKVKSMYNGYGGSYDFTDANIVAGGTTAYYRLHLVSLSGESDYSKTIKIGARRENHSYVISTMPSIFSNGFIINLSLARNEKIEIALFDVEGKIRYLKTLHLQEGFQKINVSNVSLSNGMYLLRVMGDSWSEKRWVVRQ